MRPPTVSQSVSGSSTSRSSLTSSIGVPPATRSAAVGQPLDLGRLDVVLVDDLPDDLLEEVLQGHEPGRAAVLVDDDGHVELVLLHLPQQLGHPLLLRHEDRRADELPHRAVAAGRSRTGPADDVLQVDEAEDVVGALAVRPAAGSSPASMAFSRASSTVASASTPTMSGRGTMTSRTTVSPNSKIEWMRRRSSRSIDLLVGGHVGHGADVLLGGVRALLQALAGEDDVGHADQHAGHEPQRREAGQRPQRAGQAQGGAFRCAGWRRSWAPPRRTRRRPRPRPPSRPARRSRRTSARPGRRPGWRR